MPGRRHLDAERSGRSTPPNCLSRERHGAVPIIRSVYPLTDLFEDVADLEIVPGRRLRGRPKGLDFLLQFTPPGFDLFVGRAGAVARRVSSQSSHQSPLCGRSQGPPPPRSSG